KEREGQVINVITQVTEEEKVLSVCPIFGFFSDCYLLIKKMICLVTHGMKVKDDYPDESSTEGSILTTQGVIQRGKEIDITDLSIKLQENRTTYPGLRS
ncbi:hypothetical protein LEMLEM_LOCUS6697, partial [Lemmus lemmus]